jgi:hypothetical protein
MKYTDKIDLGQLLHLSRRAYVRKLKPGSGLIKILTTKGPFLWPHLTVLRKRDVPKLEELSIGKNEIGAPTFYHTQYLNQARRQSYPRRHLRESLSDQTVNFPCGCGSRRLRDDNCGSCDLL